MDASPAMSAKSSARRRFAKNLSAISILNRQNKLGVAIGGAAGPAGGRSSRAGSEGTDNGDMKVADNQPALSDALAARKPKASAHTVGSQALLEMVMEHLQWEGMTLALQALQDEYVSRYGAAYVLPRTVDRSGRSRLAALVNTNEDGAGAAPAAVSAPAINASAHSPQFGPSHPFSGFERTAQRAVMGGDSLRSVDSASSLVSARQVTSPQSTPPHSPLMRKPTAAALVEKRGRADSMRMMKIQQPNMSDDIDFEEAESCWRVRGATVQQLIRHLAYTVSLMELKEEGLVKSNAPAVATQDFMFPEAFFLTFTRYMTAGMFIHHLLMLHQERVAARDNSSVFQVVAIVRHWLRSYFRWLPNKVRVETLPLMRHLLSSVVATALKDTPPIAEDLAEVTQLLDKAAVDVSTPIPPGIDRAMALAKAARPPAGVMEPYSTLSSLWDVPIAEIAKQWTFLDYCMFQAIPIEEFVDKAWTQPRYEHAADHVRAFIDRFNACSLFVTASIIMASDVMERARMVERFISLANHLFQLKNFTGINAVVSGLQLNPVLKMKRMWELVAPAQLEQLQVIRKSMSEERSYRGYRQVMREVGPSEVCVPHLGVHLYDLTFMEDGNEDKLPDRPNLINFQKWRMIGSELRNLLHLQTRSVSYPPNMHVCNLVNSALRPFYFHFDDDREAYLEKLQAEAEAGASADATAGLPAIPAPAPGVIDEFALPQTAH